MVLGTERRRGIYEMDQSESNSSRSTKHFPTFTWMFIRHREIVPAILYFSFAYSTNCNLVGTCVIVYVRAVLRATLLYKICCWALLSPYNLFHFPPCCAEHSPSSSYKLKVSFDGTRERKTQERCTQRQLWAVTETITRKITIIIFSTVFQAILTRHLIEEQNSGNYV
jgi:hypothetical protein